MAPVIGIVLLLAFGVIGVCIGVAVGYAIGHRAAARKYQQGFPVQLAPQKPDAGSN